MLAEKRDLECPPSVVQAEPLNPDDMIAVAVFTVKDLDLANPHLWHAPIVEW